MQAALNNFHRSLETFSKRLDFLRGNLRGILVWPIVAVLVGALSWMVVFFNVNQERRDLEHAALQEARESSHNYAGHLTRTLDSIDQIILHVKYEWELTNGQLRLDTIRHKGLFPPGEMFLVAIVNRNGMIVTSTLPGKENIFVGDRQYFLTQKASIVDFLYMGGPYVSRLSQRNVLQFSRRLQDPDKNFDGVVLISILPEYFTTTYDASVLGDQGFMAIVGNDNIIRVTRVGKHVFEPSASALTASPYFEALHGSAWFSRDWFSDRRNRYVGWQSIEGYPLVAFVGLDEDNWLLQHQLYKSSATRYAVLGTLALLVFTAIAVVLSMRLAWRKNQLEMTRATYRMATEDANEGFYIVRPVYDKTRATGDFEVVDCNHFGATLLRQRREFVIGKKISLLYPVSNLGNFMGRLQRAMNDGFYEGEMQAPIEWAASTKWLYLKVIRSNGDMALTICDISDSKAHVKELERRGNEDALTGLPNRHWAHAFLPVAIERARAENLMLAILFIDLDGFKNINDTLGHTVGDELLRHAADRLRVAVRPDDKVVRLGGDEFVVILENLVEKNTAAQVAERIVTSFKEKFSLSKGMHSIGASIGISLFPADGMDASTLLQNADIAMYSVKSAGKGNYSFYQEKFFEALRTRLQSEHELRHAIEFDEFVMHYQPRVDLKTRKVSSMEALVRWNHPVRGLLDPHDFILLAEKTGLILAIGEMVIEKVCRQLMSWSQSGQPLVPVSFNVSPRQFDEGNIAKLVSAAIARHGISPTLIEIELTESCMMGDTYDVSGELAAFQRMGIKLSIDDFGTGYSSLSQLQRLDFDVLKVDRAFTSEVEKSEKGRVFFTAIITMAHALGMRVVAEGVENVSQIKVLHQLRCDEIQGFYISRPLPPAATQAGLVTRALPEMAEVGA